MDPWPQHRFFVFIALLMTYKLSFVVIIERRGHRDSTEQSKSTERIESTEKSRIESQEQNRQKDNRNTVQVKHSMHELVIIGNNVV